MVEDHQTNDIKIVMVGDAKVGKSSLIQQFIAHRPPSHYMPTGFDKYSIELEIGGLNFYATIWDTSGSPSYDTVRPLAYQDTDVFLLCFHLGDWYSLRNVLNKWYPEVRQYNTRNVPVILVGCQNDQRFVEDLYASFQLNTEMKRTTVYSEEAFDVFREIGAITYVETCAFDPLTSRETFEVAALAANGKFKNHQTLMAAKHLSLSSTSTASSPSTSSSSNSSKSTDSANKLKSSTSSSHLLTRHKSIFKLQKCKSKSEMKVDEKKSCTIM